MKEVEKLTPQMRSAIQAKIQNPYISIADLSRLLGKKYQTVYTWFHSQVVIDEYERQVAEIWKDSVESAKIKMMELANNGDYKANEFILKCNGVTPVQDVNLKTDNSIKINITSDET